MRGDEVRHRHGQVVPSIHQTGQGYLVAYSARHTKWTWWIGIVLDSVFRFYFLPRQARLDANLRAIDDGAHLLVTAILLPAEGVKCQGIMELSKEEIIFYSISPFPRKIASWEAGIWNTHTRSPRKGDSPILRFGWPRATVIECEQGSVSVTVAAPRIDLKLVEILFSGQN